MNSASFLGRASFLALALAATTAARADDATTGAAAAPATATTNTAPAPAAGPKAYFGIGTGRTTFGYDSEQCQQDTAMPCDLKSTDTGAKIFIGANLTPTVAVEGTYYDLGSLEGTAGAGLVTLEESQTALSVAVLGLAPFNDNVGGLIRIGYYSSNFDATASGPGGTVTGSDSSRGFEFGAGLNVNFNKNVGIRLEYEQLVNAGDSGTDISLASASLRLMF